jgi:hypothetical protein
MAEDVGDDDVSDELSPEPKDPAFLRVHRAELLAQQGLRETDFARGDALRNATRRDFAVAAVYSSVAFVLSAWVVAVAKADHHLGVASLFISIVGLFVLLLWRNYFATRTAARRERAYEGVLERTAGTYADNAVFEGGRVRLPPHIVKELVPGVRYRIHAAGTEDVAVDVALDDDEIEEARKLSAYR